MRHQHPLPVLPPPHQPSTIAASPTQDMAAATETMPATLAALLTRPHNCAVPLPSHACRQTMLPGRHTVVQLASFCLILLSILATACSDLRACPKNYRPHTLARQVRALHRQETPHPHTHRVTTTAVWQHAWWQTGYQQAVPCLPAACLHLLACCSCLLRGTGACLTAVGDASSLLLLAMWDMNAVHAICTAKHPTTRAATSGEMLSRFMLPHAMARHQQQSRLATGTQALAHTHANGKQAGGASRRSAAHSH